MMEYTKKKQKSFFANVTEFILLLALVFFIRTVFFGLYQVPTPSMESTMLVGERFFADKFSYWFRKPRRGEIIAFNDPEYVYSTNPAIQLFEAYVWGPSNWTKRVIGIPGDTVEGKVEDGKPVVYLNGVKLDEPYLNKYPIIHVWTEDPDLLRAQIERELQSILRNNRVLNRANFDQIIMQKWASKTTFRSYDPQISYHDQPFYRLTEKLIIRDEKGEPEMLFPGTPISALRDIQRFDSHRYWSKSDTFYVELGDDEYWCMGDNRLGSKDCRFFGPIKGKRIHGRIPFCIWSLDSDYSWAVFDLLFHPIDFWTRVRWSRCLRFIY